MTKLSVVQPDQISFNYDLVETPVAIEAKEAAQRIRLRLRRSAEDIIEIGRDLLAMKGTLPHGHFLPWIDAEFGMSQPTASRFMGVAEAFGSKPFTVNTLPPTALYELASPRTPIEVREEVEKMIAAGEVVTKATVVELREKISGLEKAKTLAEQEIEQKTEEVAELDAKINGTLSAEIDKAAQEIAKGYRDEIDRLEAEVKRLSAPAPAIDPDFNVVPLHRLLTEEEKAEIDLTDDDEVGSDFNSIATDTARALVVFGCIRSIVSVKAPPSSVHKHIASQPAEVAAEYEAMLDQALFTLQIVKDHFNG